MADPIGYQSTPLGEPYATAARNVSRQTFGTSLATRDRAVRGPLCRLRARPRARHLNFIEFGRIRGRSV
jgi:hypothetical protein